MLKVMNETEFGKKQITAIELVNSIIDDKQMSMRKLFEYGMQVLSVREGYATIIGVKNTEGECRIFCEWLNPDEWQNGKSKMSINEFKQALLRAKIIETMPVVFVIDGKEYKIVSRTAIDNAHKQFRIWIDKDTIIAEMNNQMSSNTQYCLDFIDNVDSPNIPVDQIECDDYDIIGSIESMMSSYGVAGNIRNMAENAAKAIRSGFSYTTPDKRWSIEFPPNLNENTSSKLIGKNYLSPFEGKKLYALVKTAIAGDARLKMRTVVDTSRNAGAVMTDVGSHGTYVQEIDLAAEAYGFNVEWNGKFNNVAEIETMLKPAMDVMQKWCDERDTLLDIALGCTLYNHDVVNLPDAQKVKALQTGRLCARFKYAKEYLDSMKKVQKKI